jgi:RimJ/RimL family protein N-acetyltransferase
MSTVRLVPFGPQHVAAVDELVRDPDTLRFTFVPDPPPDGFAAQWQRRYEDGRRDGTRAGFAVEDENGTFLGLALAPVIEHEARTVELGYVVAPAARGRGVATETLRLLTAWALDEVGAERVELRISVENVGSQKAARRAGYTLEGVLRSQYFKQGCRDDIQVWSILPGDRD